MPGYPAYLLPNPAVLGRVGVRASLQMRTRGHTQMVRSRIPLAASVLLFSVHCTTSQSPPGAELAPPLQRAASLTVPSGLTGNGPHAMVVCRFSNGSNNCFPAGTPDISDAASLNAALVPPDAWFATSAFPIGFPFVHSWAVGQPINFWSYTGTFPDNTGAFASAAQNPGTIPPNMDLDDRSLFPGATGASGAQLHFTRLFTGFLKIPAGSATRSFAIASDDGYSFALGGTPAGLVSATDFGNHSIVQAYRIPSNGAVVNATFPDTAQLYPFALAAYQNGAISGVEFSWAPGADNPAPTFDGATKIWDPKNFTLVPIGNIYSPDVRATMSWTGSAKPGGVVTFHAVIENKGVVAAFPAKTPPDLTAGGCATKDGLCFTLALPVSQFNPATIHVNGAASAPTNLTTTIANTLVPVSFRSAQANELSPGDSVSIDVSVAIATQVAANATVGAQGRITGHATDPSVFTPSGIDPPYSLAVLTNDPTVIGTGDSGNRPGGASGNPPVSWAFGGFSPEASSPVPAANALLAVSPAVGGDDDDPTVITMGAAPATGPVLDAAVPAAVGSSVNLVTIQGTTAAAVPVRVELTNSQASITAAQCNALDGHANWTWDTINNVCDCFLPTAGVSWRCQAIALSHCAPRAPRLTATAM